MSLRHIFDERHFRLPRRWSNRELRKVAPLFTGDVVNVSAWDDRDKEGGHYRDYFVNATSYSVTNYSGERGLQGVPGEISLDLTEPLPDRLRRHFDVVLNHTTLEHVFDVRLAFSNLCEISRDVVILVVPFAQVLHYTESFFDYWRFTPHSLHQMFHENRLQVVYEAASRHRRSAVYLLIVGSRNPERWSPVVPGFTPLERVGESLGSGALHRFLVSLVRRLLDRQ